MPAPPKALLDANVLYFNHLRNLLLQMAQNDLFEAKWTTDIEQEWLRNTPPDIRARIEVRTLPLIRTGFPDALVNGFDPARIIGATNIGDRHVASAAVAIAPCVLITNNLRDFDALALRELAVEVRTPDKFLVALFQLKPAVVAAATHEAATNLTKTQPSWNDYLDILATRCGLRSYAACLRSFRDADEMDDTQEQ